MKSNRFSRKLLTGLLCAGIFFGVGAQTAFALPPWGYDGPRNGYAPFGGFVGSVLWCACSMNLMVNMSNLCTEPPSNPLVTSANNPATCNGSPQTLMYNPATTILYPFYQIYSAGVWLLGLWNGQEECVILTPSGCVSLGSYPLMYMVGTSM